MNTTSPSATTGDFFTTHHLGNGYRLGFAIGLFLLSIIIILAFSCSIKELNMFEWPRRNPSPPPVSPYHEENAVQVLPRRNPLPAPFPPYREENVGQVGLDEATLTSYLKLPYSEVKKSYHKDSTVMCCSICLADYNNSDMLKAMPECGHLFHVKCVDPWLRLHPTCPVCRTSPLAEVVP